MNTCYVIHRHNEWQSLKDWELAELLHYGKGCRLTLEQTGMTRTSYGIIYSVDAQMASIFTGHLTEISSDLSLKELITA